MKSLEHLKVSTSHWYYLETDAGRYAYRDPELIRVLHKPFKERGRLTVKLIYLDKVAYKE